MLKNLVMYNYYIFCANSTDYSLSQQSVSKYFCLWPLTGSFSTLNGIVIDGITTQSYWAFYFGATVHAASIICPSSVNWLMYLFETKK
jgi:hypothetical protein